MPIGTKWFNDSYIRESTSFIISIQPSHNRHCTCPTSQDTPLTIGRASVSSYMGFKLDQPSQPQLSYVYDVASLGSHFLRTVPQEPSHRPCHRSVPQP